MTISSDSIFHGSDRRNYALVFAETGSWIDADGRACHLVSVGAGGEVRRTVRPDVVGDGDREPVTHFGLSPLVEPRTEKRRFQADRRQGERRAGERGANDRREGERRRPRRYVIRRAPN